MKISIIYFSLIFALLGCTKINSSKWVIADVRVVDSATGDPLTVLSTKFSFLNDESGTPISESMSHQGTDDDGHIYVKQKVNKHQSNFKIEFSVLNYYGTFGYPVKYEVPISKYEENVYTVETEPVYPYLIHLTNVNCNDATDSIWVHSNNGTLGVYTGCVDTVIDQAYGATWYSIHPEVYLSIFAKKNGTWVNGLCGSHVLNPGELTHIQIDY